MPGSGPAALVAQPAVQKVLASTPVAGAVDYASSRLASTQKAVVASPLYGAAYGAGGAALARVQGTAIYKARPALGVLRVFCVPGVLRVPAWCAAGGACGAAWEGREAPVPHRPPPLTT